MYHVVFELMNSGTDHLQDSKMSKDFVYMVSEIIKNQSCIHHATKENNPATATHHLQLQYLQILVQCFSWYKISTMLQIYYQSIV